MLVVMVMDTATKENASVNLVTTMSMIALFLAVSSVQKYKTKKLTNQVCCIDPSAPGCLPRPHR